MRDLSLFDLDEPEWLALLRAQVEKPGNSIASVAREIGMPRPSLSLLLNGNYPAKMDRKQRKFAARVHQLYGQSVHCPHDMKAISKALCVERHKAPLTTNSAEKLRLYVACRDCANNPKNQPETGATSEEN
ncbi:MAG: hypothetical protein AAF727_06150 [Pseudomonadota bacterium]